MISASRRSPNWVGSIAGGAGLGALLALFVWVVALWPWPGEVAEHRLCDHMVEVALTSRDPIELQRAGIFIQAMNCAIGRRLPRDWVPPQ